MTARVLVVDDSALIRLTLQHLLSKESDIEVVATAPDPFIARDKIVELKPDVVTLDIEMPGMNGITFLKKIMHFCPLPVIVISSHTDPGSKLAFDALNAGAVSVIPKSGTGFSLSEMTGQLIDIIRELTTSKIRIVPDPAAGFRRVRRVVPLTSGSSGKIIAIGASTGGTKAIEDVLGSFPRNAPGAVVVQHMPASFTTSFAKRLNKACQIEVHEAQDGEEIVSGVALIAPGDRHLVVRRENGSVVAALKDGPLIHKHKPAVEMLFKSVASSMGNEAIGVILTGMGIDGAAGLLEMRNKGAHTIAQDEASCVVYGMPGAAVKKHAAREVLPLDKITESLMKHA